MNYLRKFIAIGLLIVGSTADSAILWMGGEDVDFPNGGSVCTIGVNRAGYGRHSVVLCNSSNPAFSNIFPGGAVTSVWLSAQIYGGSANDLSIGLSKSGTTSSLALGFGTSGSKLALYKLDGATATLLATETGNSVISAINKFDMQVTNYGATATVNVYFNGAATSVISYTGNVVAGAATNLDRVILKATSGIYVSEVIVSDSDTRKMSLVTLAPNAAGDLNQWTGAFTNVNPTTANDASVVSTATSGNIFQANLINLPTGTFNVLGVKASARATQTGAGITGLSLGVKTNATNNVPAAVTQAATWGTTETYYPTNPITVAPWTTTEINALQVHLQSAP